MTRAVQPGRGRRRRGDDGLATLEWLLILAAVVGLAALAVVLVQARVEDVAERTSSPSPRVTTAIYAAFAVETGAKVVSAAAFDSWVDWERHFSQECRFIAVLYADAEVEVMHNNFIRATGGGSAFDDAAATAVAAADELAPTGIKAQVQCLVR